MQRERGATKRCLNRKQRDCRQREKEETKGAGTTLSRLWVISENIGAFASPLYMMIMDVIMSFFQVNNLLLETKQQWSFFCAVLQCDSVVFSPVGPEI